MSTIIMAVTWLILAVCVILVAVQPVGINAQVSYGLTAIGVMLGIHTFRLRGVFRHIFMALGIMIAIRYLYWRGTSTLPGIEDPFSFVPGIFLFGAELYSIGMLFISSMVSADPVRRKEVELQGPPSQWPTVDVFVPSYNEDDEILGTTLAAARNLEYPAERLNIYLLDDGGTDQKCNDSDPAKAAEARDRRARLQKFCAELGIHYVTRAKNDMAKAGNLNNGMQQSNGDCIVVFDADHAPVREFLLKTIGYMQQDKKLFLVQTPHFFLNPDPVEKNLEIFNIMPSENEMFYSITQKGLDKWDASFFCGSAAVLRREALMSVGGFRGVSITEDCETALEIHSRGWSSAYVDRPMIAGFQPETMDAFLTQRSRWCQGMLQILLLKPPLFKKGLSFSQKIAYLSSMCFWMFPLARLSFMFAPVLYIFLDLEIYNASFQEFIAYTCIFMVGSVIMQSYLYGGVRWPWISETYEYIQSITLSKTIIGTIMNPKKPTFKVTDKGTSLDNDFFSDQGWTFLVCHFVLIATFAFGFYRLHLENYDNDLLLVVTFWSFFNVVLGGLALGICSEKRERRRHYRLESTATGLIGSIKVDGKDYEVDIKDLAIGGMAVTSRNADVPTDIQVGTTIPISIRNAITGKLIHTFNMKMSWVAAIDGNIQMGTRFENATARDRRTLAYLMLPSNATVAKLRVGRKNQRGILFGTFTVVYLAFAQTVRGVTFAVREAFPKKKPEPEPGSPQPLSN